jgi:Tfp pilus assembly protein PilF
MNMTTKIGTKTLFALIFAMMTSVAFAVDTGSIAADYQLNRVSANMAHGYSQVQKAVKELSRDDTRSATKHFNKALKYFTTAEDHAAKAVSDVYQKAGKELDKGNKELQKCIDAYDKGNIDNADKHYANAISHFDTALDMID